MAVVTHGSFDEGPIVLALPPIFEGLLPEGIATEADPLFTAWNKSTGISISKIQITDRSDLISTDGGSSTTDIDTVSISTSGTITASNLTGTNTGDQDLSVLVPYTGATGDVDLGGSNRLSVGDITIDNSPVNATDAITKGYFDANISSGISWTGAVIDIVSSLPGGATTGDRYILSTDDTINEWNGASWDSTAPSTGYTLYVNGDVSAPTNSVGQHTFNGTDWVYSGTSINHNDTLNKEGGGGGHWYHLSAAADAVIPNITQSGSDIVPTGLAMTGFGVSAGLDGLAWISLTWDAIVSGTIDHYIIEYKKSAYTYYTPLIATSNNILIEGLTPNTSYNFRVASVNRYGTASAFSTDLIQVTAADGTNPNTVIDVIAIGGIQYIIVEWTNNTDIDLASYNVYRNTVNDSSTATIIGNCRTNYFIDGGRTGDVPYYYWLKAVDTSGNISTSFSTYATATPRNVGNDDIVTIAGSKVLIDGVVYLSDWQKVGDYTKIDGGAISANTITTTKLNFTPVQGGDIIAKINASPEGIQIEADNFHLSGAAYFTAKVAGSYTSANSVPRIRIFPDTDTAIEIVDNLGNNTFKAYVGGTLVGDVIIGNWAGNQGIYYDKSANGGLGTTSFAGTILASGGNIGGWTIYTDVLAKDTGSAFNSSGMSPLDYPFYAGATYAYRSTAPFRVTSGGVTSISVLAVTSLSSNYIPRILGGYFSNSNITDDGKVSINTTTGLVIPRLSGHPGSPVAGMIYYNTSNGFFYGYTNDWWPLM